MRKMKPTINGFATVPSLTETFRKMKKGDSMKVKTRDYKIAAARSARYRLMKEGINLQITEAGMIDEYEVIRLN